MVGQGLAVLIGALLGALITRNLAAETLDSWGWRVPFLLGLVIGPVGLFIRRHLQETEAFLEARGAATVKQSFGTMLTLYFVLVYPLFNWVHDHPSFGSLVFVQIVLCCLLGVFFGPIRERFQ